MRKVTVEIGPVNTVKFTRLPREGRVAGKSSVIMFESEIPDGNIEAIRQEFESNWPAIVRKFNLDVERM